MRRRQVSGRGGSRIKQRRRNGVKTLRLLLLSLCLIIFASGIILVPNRLGGASAAGQQQQQKASENFASSASQTHLLGVFNLFAFLLPSPAAQNSKASVDGLWQKIDESSIAVQTERTIIPSSYQTVRLNKDALLQLLARAPMEFTSAASGSQVTITLAMPDGTFSRFSIEESPIMEPKLAARYPDIKTYRGQGIDDPTATTRFGITPAGFHAIILSAGDTAYIDPYAKGDSVNHISYYKRHLPGDRRFECHVGDFPSKPGAAGVATGADMSPNVTNAGTLRTYRLALAATGEYTMHFSELTDTDEVKKDKAFAALTATVNRVDGVYERELSVRMVLINNERDIIYTNLATDPYPTDPVGISMLVANQVNLDAPPPVGPVGEGNYDIGHVVSTGFGGVAFLASVCDRGDPGTPGDGSNAGGFTGLDEPSGDGFDIDFVAHEMGHQFGGNHTFNGSDGSCGGNEEPTAAMEPGSGSTIMPYAGICGAQDLQPHSDDYFHIRSLEELVANTTGGGSIGNSCDVETAVANVAPDVNAGADYTIPKETPFTLTATGSDPDGHPITYNWEEYDTGPQSAPGQDNDNDNQPRPIFRSYEATLSPTRTFPSLQYILNNANTPPMTYDCGRGAADPCLTGEDMPSMTRTMKFQVTARDNRAAGGGIDSDLMQISVRNEAGPFIITAPNTAVNWAGGSTQTVTWNVANTTAAPVSAANVKISLSTDGGNTFPAVLIASTANDGTETVSIPNTPSSTTARIKVEAVGNIFFDISNANFTITGMPVPPYRAPFDFDGDNKSDFSLFRGSDGQWSVLSSLDPAARARTIFWGNESLGDKIVPGDYDGDGKTDFAVYRSTTGVWYISRNSGGDVVIPWGSAAANDQPVPADYDGDGRTDIAVFRPTEGSEQGIWYVLKSSDNYNPLTYIRRQWGISSDKPVPADFDFDGKADFAIVRADDPSAGNATWYVGINGSATIQSANWGLTSDKFVVGDYDGDRKADYAVWRPSNGDWYVFKSTGGVLGSHWGQAGDIPVPADYDGDGKTDLAVYRPSDNTWYIFGSTAGVVIQNFGGSSETPVPSAYVQ